MKQYDKVLPKRWHSFARVYTALGDEHRQRMLLMFQNGEALTTQQITDSCPLSRTAVRHHLRVLREAGVLRATKVGKEVLLSPEPKAVLEALNGLRDYIHEQLA
jgi:ArsR family transcriptional regulator, arsenate/arsenite/antimonite-responsive transcriptional repressor